MFAYSNKATQTQGGLDWFKGQVKWLIMFVTVALPNVSSANNELRDEIGGLVIDRTITRFGKVFYQDFTTLWREIKGSQNYSLAIIEKPLPQSGTVLWIELQGKKIYQTYFGRRHSGDNQQITYQAIQIVTNKIVDIMTQQMHPDFKGDGY